MNEQDVQAKIEQARKLVGGDPSDPLTQVAFEVVFRKLLEAGEIPTAEKRRPLIALQMQLSEFLASKNLKSHMDRVEAIAWYFLHENHENSVTSKDILDAYSKARMQRPKNLTDVINQCVRRGHLVDAPGRKEGRKAWQITPTAEAYVEQQL